MARAKGIVELQMSFVKVNTELARIFIKEFPKKMAKYYWDQIIYFNLFISRKTILCFFSIDYSNNSF